MTTRNRSHFMVVPHPADIVIEAWGESGEECLESAARGLVTSFAHTAGVPARGTRYAEFHEEGTDLLAALLERVITLVGTEGVVPLDVAVHDHGDFGVAVGFAVASLADVDVTGPTPAAVERGDLRLERDGAGYRCHAVIDV